MSTLMAKLLAGESDTMVWPNGSFMLRETDLGMNSDSDPISVIGS